MCRWKIVSSLTTIHAKCIRNMTWCTMIEFLICFSKISTPSIWRCTIISTYTLALNLILSIQWHSSRRPKMIPGNSSKKKRKSASDLKWKSCWNGRDTKPDLGTSTISISGPWWLLTICRIWGMTASTNWLFLLQIISEVHHTILWNKSKKVFS